MNARIIRVTIKFLILICTLLLVPFVVNAQVQIPEGFKLAAENRSLELYVDPNLGQLIVVHKESGHIWRSNPDPSTYTAPNETWAANLKSTLMIKYSDPRARAFTEVSNMAAEAIIEAVPIPDGVRLIYNIQARGFVIPVDYTIGLDYLEARVVVDEIEERRPDTDLLFWINVLPFFGAVNNKSQGMMIIPDKSGAITIFTDDHPDYPNGYEKKVYEHGDGKPLINTPLKNIDIDLRPDRSSSVIMPVFGIIEGDKGFIGIITEGEFDAEIKAYPSGFPNSIYIYRTSANFAYRNTYFTPVSSGATDYAYVKENIPGDKTIRYYFKTGDEATYIGLANTYRKYLQEHNHIAGRIKINEENVIPIHIRIMHAVVKEGLISDKLVVMTTFAEAKEILQSLIDVGITEMDVTLVGWTKNGVTGIYPRRMPAEPALGGDKGLRELIDWAHSQGLRVYLEDNYVNANSSNGGFHNRYDVIRTPGGVPVINKNAKKEFVLSPVIAYSRFAYNDIPEMKKRYDADGLELTQFSRQLFIDYNLQYTLQREDVAYWWSKIASKSKLELGSVNIRGGASWLIPTADRLVDVDIDDSRQIFIDHSIPFYQTVLSGLVPYSTYPSNLRNDPRYEYLKMIEYGAVPTFELTYRDSSLLSEVRTYNQLFSSLYTTWLPSIIEEYQSACVEMGYLKTMVITEHMRIDENVFMVGYEDGSKVYVNYRDTEYVTNEGLVLPALDYVLIRGGEY
jgi:hypothetical protein